MSPGPKKSETLEVRLPYATKLAFMSRCRAGGLTASEAVRGFIEKEIEQTAAAVPMHLRWWQALAALVGGLAIGAFGAPSLAHPTPPSKAAFERLDRNHDGLLSLEEFRRG